MNKTVMTLMTTMLFLFVALGAHAAAYDLRDYPSPFVAANTVNTIIVVGDNAPASHVVAQTRIALALGQEAGNPATGKAKLASEVENLNTNIISIGNPCINSVSAQIVPYNKNCHEGYTPGKASIKVYENGNYLHVVAAGYTDEATAEAASLLQQMSGHGMSGQERTITFQETVEAQAEEAEQEQESEASAQETGDTEEEPGLTADNDAPQGQQREASSDNDSGKPVIMVEEEQNLIQRLFSWLGSLFS